MRIAQEGTVRAFLAIGAIAFVGLAFVVFSIARGSFIAQMTAVAAAGVLTLLALSIASVRVQRSSRRAAAAVPPRRADRERPAPPQDPERESPHVLLLQDSDDAAVSPLEGPFDESPRRLVESYVPFPKLPSWPLTAITRRQCIRALKEEGQGLLRLAEGFHLDLRAYREWVEDARRAALRGEYDAPLRSIKLANELLRSAVEKEITKRDKMRQQDFER
jgi:hypothetical protein